MVRRREETVPSVVPIKEEAIRDGTEKSGARLRRDGLVQENDFGGGKTTKETLRGKLRCL